VALENALVASAFDQWNLLPGVAFAFYSYRQNRFGQIVFTGNVELLCDFLLAKRLR